MEQTQPTHQRKGAVRVGAEQILEAMSSAYAEFESESRELARGGTKTMFNGLRKFVLGSGGSADELLCEQFHKRVTGLLADLEGLLPELTPDERAQTCAAVAELMLTPRGEGSNRSRDLMVRAMAGQ
ncbi:MAG: hypothetical protein IJ751_02860, partial [Oscillospiraceae bacterium]|nr:hypothetical protein [Oscillospiraceae bacterium]